VITVPGAVLAVLYLLAFIGLPLAVVCGIAINERRAARRRSDAARIQTIRQLTEWQLGALSRDAQEQMRRIADEYRGHPTP
jgi:hypothetical protein